MVKIETLRNIFRENLIYVIGNARGGSTVFNSAVGVHPQIMGIDYNNKIFTQLMPNPEKDSMIWKELLLRRRQYYWEGEIRKRTDAETWSRLHLLIDQIVSRRDLGSIFCLYPLLYYLSGQGPSSSYGLKAWCIKDNSWIGANELMQALPRTQLVIIQRDPRSVALSMAKVKLRGTKRELDVATVVRAAFDWFLNAYKFRWLQLEYPNNVTLVRYEDFISDPPGELNRVYRKVGLPPVEKNKLEKGLSTLINKRTWRSPDDYINPVDRETVAKARKENKSVFGIQQDGLMRWKDELNQEMVDAVTLVTRQMASDFGYRLDQQKVLDGAWQVASRVGSFNDRTLFLARYGFLRITGIPLSYSLLRSPIK